MINFRLALKFFYRELKQGDLTLLFVAVIIAIASLSSIGFLTGRVEQSIQTHATRLSGGALILKSSTPVPSEWLQQADSMQLEVARMVSFPSMLSMGDEFKLAHVKAVTDNFPLQGELYIKQLSAAGLSAGQTEQTRAPPAGHIWIAPRLWHFFADVAANTDSLILDLGEAQFQLSAQLENIPGQSSGTLFSIAPAALINMADLEKTATVQTGSRVEYLYFFSPLSNAKQIALAADHIDNYRHWLEQRLYPGQSVNAGAEGVRAVNSNIKKASQFLSLAALLSVLLSAIAIVISSHQYGLRQNKNNAILLCLGANDKTIFKIALAKLLLLGLIASWLGVLIGYLVQAALLNTLQDLIPKPLPPLSLIPVWSGLLSGVLLIMSVSIVNLLRIRQLSPMAIMRNERGSIPGSRLLLYSFTLLAIFLISFWTTQDIKMTLWFYGSIIAAAIGFYFCAKIFLVAFLRISQRFALINRLSWINIQRHQKNILLQITSFSLIFALLIILYLLRTELMEKWQQQLPDRTPNHFVINLQDYEIESFQNFLSQQKVKSQGVFPMIRGRLIQLNNQAVKDVIPEQARSHNALNRELNLSFAMEQDVGQRLLAGQWWDREGWDKEERDKRGLQKSQIPLISIESSLAQALGIGLGDKLAFQIGSRQIEGVVTNIRQVKWDSFKPNFYIIFSPGNIERYPMSYISSFYLAAEQKNSLNEMMNQFPGISIIEVDKIISEIQYMTEKISLAIEFVFFFILIAGFLVLASSLNSTLEVRLYENAILRILGASAKMIRRSLAVEFIVVAILSAVIGMIIAEVAGTLLYRNVFNLSYSLHPWLWSVVIIVAVVIITAAGLLLMNKILTQTAAQSLSKYS